MKQGSQHKLKHNHFTSQNLTHERTGKSDAIMMQSWKFLVGFYYC